MVLIAVFIPASQMHSVSQAFARVALDAWSCLFFFLWGGKRSILSTAFLGPQVRTRTRACPVVCLHPSPPGRGPGLRFEHPGSGEFRFASGSGRGGLGQHSLCRITSFFPAIPMARKASISSLVVQSGLACSLSTGTT